MRMNSARLGNAVRIVIAPDKFKGSLSAAEAARCLSTGIREARADAEVAVVPRADGGEGTLDAALANGYERREAVVHGPLGAPLRASFAMRGDEAVVELAVASGLALVPAGRRDALAASSRGTGELIAAALDAGATRIVLAIGGSASTDGGAGLIAALGARLLNASGAEVAEGGGAISAPIHDHRGALVRAIMLSAPRFRVPAAMLEPLGRAVADAAGRVSARLGGAPAPTVPPG